MSFVELDISLAALNSRGHTREADCPFRLIGSTVSLSAASAEKQEAREHASHEHRGGGDGVLDASPPAIARGDALCIYLP